MGCPKLDITSYFRLIPTTESEFKLTGVYAGSSETANSRFKPVVSVSILNYRYYSPELGRWLRRDPIEEEGGINVYGMISNNPVNWWDENGLEPPSAPEIVIPPINDGWEFHKPPIDPNLDGPITPKPKNKPEDKEIPCPKPYIGGTLTCNAEIWYDYWESLDIIYDPKNCGTKFLKMGPGGTILECKKCKGTLLKVRKQGWIWKCDGICCKDENTWEVVRDIPIDERKVKETKKEKGSGVVCRPFGGLG